MFLMHYSTFYCDIEKMLLKAFILSRFLQEILFFTNEEKSS
jgi:hypothetical protein